MKNRESFRVGAKRSWQDLDIRARRMAGMAKAHKARKERTLPEELCALGKKRGLTGVLLVAVTADQLLIVNAAPTDQMRFCLNNLRADIEKKLAAEGFAAVRVN